MSYWNKYYWPDSYWNGYYWPARSVTREIPFQVDIPEVKLDKIFNSNLIFSLEVNSDYRLVEKQIALKIVSDYSFIKADMNWLLYLDEDLWLSKL